MIIYIGDASYDDLTIPSVGKSDWGMDTLTRNLAGRRDQFQTFIASLVQGQAAPDPYAGFKLQTWDPDPSDPIWGRVQLNYKGLVGGVTPPDQAYNEIIETSGSSSHNWTTPYDYGGGFFAVSAVMDFTYYAGQTTYRYVRTADPGAATHSSLATTFITSLKRVHFTVSNEDGSTTVFGGSAPVGIVSATSPVLSVGAVGYRSSPVLGTGFFEMEDVVRAELRDAGG
jgi:hypothetical protein